MSNLYSNSVFFIEVEKIVPNPFQPRREFEEGPLRALADSIRQYGVLQPLVVTRVEKETEEGGLATEYELIAGERRLRASKLAGLREVPVIIRQGDDNMMKLELAIIENLQREDLNVVERARAFLRLAEEFKFTHVQIGKKVGKSREYVSNTLRILSLPQEILDALSAGQISEGHTRPLMMLSDRPEEQITLFKEIVVKKISVREAERISRKIAYDKVRKREYMPDPEISDIEMSLQEALGTRVHIERQQVGGKILIDFFTSEDLRSILDLIKSNQQHSPAEMVDKYMSRKKSLEKMLHEQNPELEGYVPRRAVEEAVNEELPQADEQVEPSVVETEPELIDDRAPSEAKEAEEDADLYNISKFSL